MPDFANLPLILAGPLLRRVEPTLVSVWVALSAERTVEVGLWSGETAVTSPGFFGNGSAQHTASAATKRVGAKLHLSLITLDLTATPLIPGQLYAYNLVFSGGANEDLNSLTLLDDAGPPAERTHLALGYVPGQLPTFSLPPIELNRLQLVHGSCRKAHGFGPDGLAALDKIIERSRTDPFARPHQLFLTGDQVYADDVAMMLLPQLTEAGIALLGVPEKLPLGSSAADNITVSTTNFPTTWRQELTAQKAKFSSHEASSHVMSFGEFCALYLFFWSNVLWDDLVEEDAIFAIPGNPETNDGRNTIVNHLPNHLKPLYPPEKRKEAIKAWAELQGNTYTEQLSAVKAFRKTLPNVRRALANVPSYMIFDDHEITDDWYLTEDWRDKVLTSPLGVTILRNGLLSFALFQAWGNDPKRFASGNHAQLLTLGTQLFAGSEGPDLATANQLDTLFGFGGADPQVQWHFTVPTGPTHTAVLDTRTWRSFNGRFSPPGLLSNLALDAQLPPTLAPSPGAEILFLVSPAPVLGLALIEELAQPLAARGVADFFMSVMWRRQPEITGYMEWDLEAWALDAPRFEALLARCNEFNKVVILSGDVHYAFSAEMDYWQQGQPEPSRIVQLTASAFKNEWGAKVKRSLETVTVQELMHNAYYPVSRLGWDSPLDLKGRLSVPGGRIPRTMRALLRRTPTVIPTEGWPSGTTISIPPEWAWRMSLVKDTRPDDDSANARPTDGQVAPITPDLNPADPVDGYVKVLLRGEKQIKNKIARSVVFASNLGLVTFSGTGDTLKVKHSLMYNHAGSKKAADPQPYTEYEIALTPTTDPLPAIS